MSICVWIVFGFFAGLIGRALMPGAQKMGFIMTTVLGVCGSFVGGSIAAVISGGDPFRLRPAGFLGAILGSIVLLIIGEMVRKSFPSW